MYLTTKQQQFEIQLLNTQKRSVQCRYSAEISREIAVASQCKFLIKIMTPPVDPSILRWHTNTNKKCSRCEFWRGLCILFGKAFKKFNSFGFYKSLKNYHLYSVQKLFMYSNLTKMLQQFLSEFPSNFLSFEFLSLQNSGQRN